MKNLYLFWIAVVSLAAQALGQNTFNSLTVRTNFVSQGGGTSYISGATTTLRGTNLTLEALGDFRLFTPGIAAGSVESGYVLRLNDDANGQAEYVPLQVSTVAALKALPVGSVPDGWMVQTTGYYTDADQGQGTYVYRASSTETANNGSVIAPDFLPGRFLLLPGTSVNVRQFGATGYTVAYSPYVGTSVAPSTPGTNNFTVWVDFQVPTYDANARSITQLAGNETVALANSFELFGASNYFTILVRSTNGASSTGSGAGQLLATNIFLPYQGTRVQAAVVRTNGLMRVYVGTNDLTAAFAITNPSQVAAAIGGATTSGLLSTSQQNANSPTAPVFAVKYFNSAFTLTQLAGASTNTSFVATASSPNTATSLTDSWTNFQTALNYAKSSGIRQVFVPAGYYMSSNQLSLPAGVTVTGDGPMNWDTGRGATAAKTKIGLSFGSTATNLFRIDDSTVDRVGVNLKLTAFADGSYGTNWFHGGNLRGLWLDASASTYATPVEASLVSGVNMEDIVIQQNRGAMFVVWGCNAFNMSRIYMAPSIGSLLGGIYLFSADNHLVDFDYGGSSGPGLLIHNSNKNDINNCFVWNQVASGSQLSAPTVNTATDTFAATGHHYWTGMPVRFAANGGTLPSPLAEGTMYWAVRVDANTIAVNSQRTQGTVGGALQGVKLDLTTGGSGAWTMRPYALRDANVVMSDSSANTLTGGRYDQALDSAIVLDNCFAVTATSNFSEAGYNGSSTTPSVLITGGQSNIVLGSIIGKVRPSSQSDIGVLLTNTLGNIVRNNIYYGLTTRVSGDATLLSLARPDVLTTSGDFLIGAGTALSTTATNGFLMIPAMFGPPTGTPTDYGDVAPLVADFTNRRVYYNDNGTWRHTPFWTGTTGASVSTANTLTLTPNSGSSALITRSEIAGSSADLYNFNATPAVRINTYAANGTAGSPTQITTGQTIFDLQPGARTDSGGYNLGYARLRAIVSENQTAASAGISWVIGATSGGTAVTNVLTVAGNGTDVIGRVTATQGATLGSTGRAIRILDYGNAELVAGTVTVAETDVTNNGRIFLTSNFDGGTPGWLRVSARVANTSFTITSSSATDTSTVSWVLIEP